MNIFVTSEFHSVASTHLDDVRLRKMVLETAQMVCTTLNVRFGIETPYRPTHKNHPCNVWAREASYNLHWLIQYGCDLHDEYIMRFGKTHKSGVLLEKLWADFTDFVYNHENTFEEMTPFVNCARRKDLNLDFTHLPVVEAYQTYLNARWAIDKRRPTWTNREPPFWANYTWHGDKI